MILVADSGSTITDWALIDKNAVNFKFKTIGFNPYFIQKEEIFKELKQKFPTHITVSEINKIFFYGSGCSSNAMRKIISNGLNSFFMNSENEINTDLLGAARAMFNYNEGIAVILGTGASSCFYNGIKIIKRIPSLGYILGDEGGGDYLGKLFITDLLNGSLSKNIDQKFRQEFQLTNDQIMQKLYKEAYPNRFLASFCKFISEHNEDIHLNGLIIKSFTDLFERNLTKYEDFKNYKIRISGSIGYYFKEQLKKLAYNFDADIDLIERFPINGLAKYHFNTQ